MARSWPKRMVRRIVRTLGIVSEVNVVGSIRAAVLMNIAVLVRGYVLALRRLHDAVTESHANDIYVALFEASNWLDSISERDAGLNSRAELQAVKFVRNRTHHQWASAVQLQDEEWRWRPLENLPVPDDPKHRNAKLEPLYERHLAGRPVVDVFDGLEPHVTALAPDADLS
jgi:hypothetical protein